MAGNDTTVDTVIYFTTQSATAPDITSLSVSSVAHSSAIINWSTDVSPASGQYRVATSAYSGSWSDLSVDGTSGTKSLTELAANTTYYYQVRFVKNGQTVNSVPMSFKTASAST
jgi:hypothetical protein